MAQVTYLEICAGAGVQALGLEQAGFEPEALVEIDKPCCNTLRINRPLWNVIEEDLRNFKGSPYKGVDYVIAMATNSQLKLRASDIIEKAKADYEQRLQPVTELMETLFSPDEKLG